LLAAYDLSGRNPDEASEREFAARLLERLRSLPDVEPAAIATNVPLDLHGKILNVPMFVRKSEYSLLVL
jgi:hypothetical protein